MRRRSIGLGEGPAIPAKLIELDRFFYAVRSKTTKNIKQEKATGEDSICSRERKTKPHIQTSFEFLTVLQEKEKKEGCKFS